MILAPFIISLRQGYKALVVEGSGSGYLSAVCDYVHLNPVRAQMLAASERLLAYSWSSLGWYLEASEHRPAWMREKPLAPPGSISPSAGKSSDGNHLLLLAYPIYG